MYQCSLAYDRNHDFESMNSDMLHRHFLIEYEGYYNAATRSPGVVSVELADRYIEDLEGRFRAASSSTGRF